jgi:FtsP/CotA-like multicopper oxidase with cupredoxin domain
MRSSVTATGEVRYCYLDEKGNQSPTLRLNPGDVLILKLTNDLPDKPDSTRPGMRMQSGIRPGSCAFTTVPSVSTNLHFHGLMIPPACHQDDVLHTAIGPGQPAYEYRVRIPATQPPGLYWYHPHPHGESEAQVLGGASGALIVEGIERYNPALAGLPERLLVIRDQPLAAHGAGPKPPAEDLSVNFVPLPYPNFPPAIIHVNPGRRELWRVLNASADTFLELHLLTKGKWQSLGLVSLDGVPLNYESKDKGRSIRWTDQIALPPGGRAEFLFDGPPEAVPAQLLTAGIDTVPFVEEDGPAALSAQANPASLPPSDDDDYTPPRWLLSIVSTAPAAEVSATIPQPSGHAPITALPALQKALPTRVRKLYFSEKIVNAGTSQASTTFYLTEEGKRRAPFNSAAAPNIRVRQGDVEDWVIENRSQELHTFHIHQTHFLVLARDRKPVQEKDLLDTITVPFWDGISKRYPSVTLRMDFRDPEIIGTFPYHCHILRHEDGGMMGTIQVLKGKEPR